jgi:hypothetical protein
MVREIVSGAPIVSKKTVTGVSDFTETISVPGVLLGWNRASCDAKLDVTVAARRPRTRTLAVSAADVAVPSGSNTAVISYGPGHRDP